MCYFTRSNMYTQNNSTFYMLLSLISLKTNHIAFSDYTFLLAPTFLIFGIGISTIYDLHFLQQ